jgi:AP-1 complex subunit sigma 1/2
MIHFLLLISRHGKVRLAKFFANYTNKERTQLLKEVKSMVIGRMSKLCNFLEWRDQIVVYRRYASLYFVACIDKDDNELITLETVHFFVELLDRYFGNVCELDIIFNFHKAYYILDEMMMAGHILETSKKQIHRVVSSQDALMEEAKEEAVPTRRR